jgi:hypothetical protein
MNKLLVGAASLTMASAMVMNAAITSVGPADYDNAAGPLVGGLPAGPWSLSVPFTVDWTAGSSDSYGSPSWAFTVGDDGATLPGFRIVIVEGVHKVAIHPGEAIPSNSFNGGVIFPQLAGSGGIAYGVVEHHVPSTGGDHWLIDVRVNAAGTGADGKVYAWHVPEPSAYALVAGLGLVGFAAYRRVRA